MRITGVVSRPELNGEVALCEQYIAMSGRWQVRLGSGEQLSLQPRCLVRCVDNMRTTSNADPDASPSHHGDGDNRRELAPGVRVRIGGLVTRPELNGEVAVCVEYLVERRRWQVQTLDGEEQLQLKPAALCAIP